MKRKEFFQLIGGALVGGFAIAGCGSSDNGGDGDGDGDGDGPDAGAVDCAASGVGGRLSGNHGHSILVSAADIAAGVEKTYEIQADSTHPHSVTITAAEFARLQAAETVTLMSSTDAGHSHVVTFECG